LRQRREHLESIALQPEKRDVQALTKIRCHKHPTLGRLSQRGDVGRAVAEDKPLPGACVWRLDIYRLSRFVGLDIGNLSP
jgi:hypothetical protein